MTKTDNKKYVKRGADMGVCAKRNKQYEIWLREGRSGGRSYGYYYVPVGESIHLRHGKPIKRIVYWIPNINDAGRILQRVVEVTVEFRLSNREDAKLADEPPAPESAPKSGPESDLQTPGIG